jgi:anti-sigma-K factor RskA
MQPEARHAALIDRLAAEYVLGTLRGPARRRFERWRVGNELVAGRCHYWEQQLAGLAEPVPPVQPPYRLWLAIEQRLGLAGNARLWRAVASIALLGLVGALVAQLWHTGIVRPDEVAEIGAPGGAVQWRVEVYANEHRLVMRAPTVTAKPVDRDFELWVITADGSKVLSLGVMPVSGERAEALTAAQSQALMAGARVAVSVEPLGGSPTGVATGPIVFVAPLRSAG